MAKMTLERFIEKYSHAPWEDEEYAEAIVLHLGDDVPLVRAAMAFLEACKAFDAAMEAVGLERG